MGKPAARISDNHTCPQKTGKIPHVGGPIIKGSPNVFIGGLPAARVGDQLVCVGPPDAIAKGSASVFINGIPAARLGDKTAHNGVIVSGEASVLIGDAGIPNTASGGGSGEQTDSQTQQGDDNRSNESPIIIAQQEAALESAAERAQGICQVCEERQDEQ